MNQQRAILFTVAIVVAAGNAANTVRGGTLDRAWLHASATAVGQAPAGPEAARSQSDDLLRRARQAMAEGNLETAESLVSRAESMKTDYGLFHMGDTPKKARRDLEKSRESRGAKPAGDPFAARPPITAPAAAGMTPPGGMPPGSMPANMLKSPEFWQRQVLRRRNARRLAGFIRRFSAVSSYPI